MPNKLLVTQMDGTPKQIVFADHAGDFFPTAANDLRQTTDGTQETDVQLSMASVADGAARQAAKFDLGENWAKAYRIRCAFEFAATPTAGEKVELYFGESVSGTAGAGNPANLSGTDAAYTGYSSNLADSVGQLNMAGLFICTAQATTTVQVGPAGIWYPTNRYGLLVVKNEAGAAYHSDDVETHIVLDPIVDEVQ